MLNKNTYDPERVRKDFAWVDRVSWLMDNKFTIGLGRFRFGFDPLLNLVPYLGNLVGAIISIMLVGIMWRNGVSGKVVILMLLNVLIDLIIGAIPIVGQVGDFFYKSNARNIRLLKAHYFERKYQGRGFDVIIAILLMFLALLVVASWLLYEGVNWLIGLF